MWNLRNKTDEHMGGGMERGKQTKRDSLKTENKLMVIRGRWMGDGLDG